MGSKLVISGPLPRVDTTNPPEPVPAPPAEVFRLWTCTEGIGKFFAPDARIDAVTGGRYEILFAPAKDPEGNSHGTKGARILKLVPDKELAFEWITFAGDGNLDGFECRRRRAGKHYR